jgi:hypothetical protein
MDPLYFLDEISQDEVAAIIKAKEDAERTSWEQTRTIAFYNLIGQRGTKGLHKPEDLFQIRWDKKAVKKDPVGPKLTKEELNKKIQANRLNKYKQHGK